MAARAHTRQAVVILGDKARRMNAVADTTPVVSDGESQVVGVLCQAHDDLGGVGVLQGVVKRFLGNAEDRQSGVTLQVEHTDH